MRATQHASNNTVLTATGCKDHNGEPIAPLAATVLTIGNPGVRATVTFWQPTAEELLALRAGAVVAVWALGSTVPPMALSVEKT